MSTSRSISSHKHTQASTASPENASDTPGPEKTGLIVGIWVRKMPLGPLSRSKASSSIGPASPAVIRATALCTSRPPSMKIDHAPALGLGLIEPARKAAHWLAEFDSTGPSSSRIASRVSAASAETSAAAAVGSAPRAPASGERSKGVQSAGNHCATNPLMIKAWLLLMAGEERTRRKLTQRFGGPPSIWIANANSSSSVGFQHGAAGCASLASRAVSGVRRTETG